MVQVLLVKFDCQVVIQLLKVLGKKDGYMFDIGTANYSSTPVHSPSSSGESFAGIAYRCEGIL